MNSLNTTICLLFTHFTAWTQRCSRSYRRSRSCGTARPPRFQRRARSTRWPGRQRPSRTQRSPWSQCEWHHQCASCLHSPAQLSINDYKINRFFLKINKGVKDSFLSCRVLVWLTSRSCSSAEVWSRPRCPSTPPPSGPSALRAAPSTTGRSSGPRELKGRWDHLVNG